MGSGETANLNYKEIGGVKGGAIAMSSTPITEVNGTPLPKGVVGDQVAFTGNPNGDGLLTKSVKTPVTQNPGKIQTITMTESFELPTQADVNGIHELENDLPTGAPKGSPDASEMIASQINVHTGQLDIDGPQGGWEAKDVGSLGGPLVAGKEYQLEISATENQINHTVTVNGYYINGKNLLSKPLTFADKSLNWGPGNFIQTQIDLQPNVAKDTTVHLDEFNKTLWILNQNPASTPGSSTPA
jgi:hypothetical protein